MNTAEKAIYMKEYRAKNKAHIRKLQNSYFKENRETVLAQRRANYAANRDRIRNRNLNYNRANPDKVRQWSRKAALKLDYGITPERYVEMFSAQLGLCDICKGPSLKRLGVDHDHETGKVRGLLCDNCNRALGGFKDNVKLLLSAVNYLEKHADYTYRRANVYERR